MKRLHAHFAFASALALGFAAFTPLSVSAKNQYQEQYQNDGYRHTHTVCRNVEVPDSRDHHRIAGTAIGAIAGGLLGHTIGGGSGKTLATVGGAVAGGYVGNRVQANNQSKNYHIERRCHQE